MGLACSFGGSGDDATVVDSAVDSLWAKTSEGRGLLEAINKFIRDSSDRKTGRKYINFLFMMADYA